MWNSTITAEILARSLAHWLTYEFIIYAMRQLVRAYNLTTCYRKKKTKQNKTNELMSKFFLFGHRSLIRNSTQTAVTNMTIKRMLKNKII